MADTETHRGADAPDLSLIICTLNEGVAIRGVIEEISDALAIQSLQRLVDPRDVAALAVFLASDAAKSISGQMIPIDNDSQKAL